MSKKLIILYVMDALRPDHLGCYGYERPTSKHIDQLAETGLVFENIYAQSTETKSSAATINTSTYPSVHKTVSYGDQLPNGLVTLAETLHLSGFVTAAFNTNFRLSAEYGFNRGFDYYLDLHEGGEHINVANLPSSEYLTKKVLSWLDSISSKKIFILIWSMDTHIPYSPPLEFATQFINQIDKVPDGTAEAIFRAKSPCDYQTLIDLYDAEISYNDSQIEQLTRGLKARGKWNYTTFVLTSDHGEMFLEHGHFIIHGGVPYHEMIHVPLIIKSPDLNPARNDRLGGLIDLMPTILQIAGIPLPEKIQGFNLFDKRQNPLIFSESYQENGGHSIAVLNFDWKLIQATSFLRYQVLGRLFRLILHKKKNKRMKQLKYDVLNKGMPPLLIRKALLKRHKNDFIGMPPICKKGYNKILWGKLIFKHFFGCERIEFYDRQKDPFEQKNLTAKELHEIQALKHSLEDFNIKNRSFKKDLAINHRQIPTDDELIQERLRHLGYFE